jgi:hypothetical protein
MALFLTRSLWPARQLHPAYNGNQHICKHGQSSLAPPNMGTRSDNQSGKSSLVEQHVLSSNILRLLLAHCHETQKVREGEDRFFLLHHRAG